MLGARQPAARLGECPDEELARLQRIEETHDAARAAAGAEPTFLTGELNARPGEESIQLRTSAETSVDGRSPLVDCWNALRPLDPGLTAPSWAPIERIDYIMSAVPVKQLVSIETVGAEVDGVHASDHLGLVLEAVV